MLRAAEAEADVMILPVGFSAFAIFLGIASIGFLFLLVSFIFGEIFGHLDFGGHDADLHGDGHDAGVSFFSTRVLSVFITAFGGFGAIGIHLGYSIEASTGLGMAGGLVFGMLIYLFASFLFSQQASSEVRVQDMVGKTAQVFVAIPQDGLGQVRCTLGDCVVEKIARSQDGAPIPLNALVTIESLVGETCLVRRVN
jgi:membrane protein implicated in regulation of membrane protease activity